MCQAHLDTSSTTFFQKSRKKSIFFVRTSSREKIPNALENVASDGTSPRYSQPQSLRKLGFVFKFSINPFVVGKS